MSLILDSLFLNPVPAALLVTSLLVWSVVLVRYTLNV